MHVWLYVCMYLFLKQGLMYPKLFLNLLCGWGWLWTPTAPATTPDFYDAGD